MSHHRFSIPFEKWRQFSRRLALVQLSNQKKGKLVSVPTFTHDGYRYLGDGAVHGLFGSEFPYSIQAYRLVPESLYKGGRTTTIYHDEQEIASGFRERGDLSGLIVSENGGRLVCERRTTFLAALPSLAPMGLAEAQSYERSQQNYGGRAHSLRGKPPEWFSLQGHPIASYFNDAGEVEMHILFWRPNADEVDEMRLDKRVEVDDVSCVAFPQGHEPSSFGLLAAPMARQSASTQISLF